MYNCDFFVYLQKKLILQYLMKKILLSVFALLMGAAMNAQTLMSEDFSEGIPSTWTMFQDNNTAYNSNFTNAWTHVESYGNPAPAVVSASWFVSPAQADRWLITDALTIPDSGYVFAIDAMCYELAYADGFAVKVSTTNRDSRNAFTETILSVEACTDAFVTYQANLDAFIGDTIYIAVVQNSNDKNFLIADNFKVHIPANYDVELASLNLPAYAPSNSDIAVTGTIVNKGALNLEEFDVTYNVNGGDNVAVFHVADLDLEYNESYTFTHNVPFNTSETGTYTINVTVSNPNNSEDQIADNNGASATVNVYDPETITDRTVLIEQFTGAGCGYCPGGANRIAQAVDGRDDYIWITHHAGFGTDDLSNPSSSQMTWFYGSNSTYAPAMMFDRTHFDANEPGPVMGVGDVATITSFLNAALQVPCFLELDMSGIAYDKNSRAISGNVSGQFAGVSPQNARITIYLVEDSIVMRQANYDIGAYDNNYVHMRTARATLTDAWGDAVTIGDDGSFSFPVNHTLATNHKDWRCRLVAVVYNLDQTNVNNCAVFNSATTANFEGNYVGIDEVSASISLDIYPNPVTDHAVIESTEPIQNITVVNAIGQVVYSQNNVNDSVVTLNTQQYAAGMYIVTVKSESGISTKRISIVK